MNWLASPSANNTNNVMNVNYNGNVNNNNYNNTNYGVRPVASKKLWLDVQLLSKRSFRIETNLCPLAISYKLKIDKYIC